MSALTIEQALQLAMAHIQAGRASDGESVYRQILAAEPANAPAHNGLGEVLLSREQMDAALEEFRHAVRLQSDFARAHHNLGNALAAKGRFDLSADSFRKVIQLKPDFIDAYVNLGNALALCGRREDALAAYRHGLAIQPEHWPLHNNLGQALLEAGRPAEAADSFRQALRLQPQSPERHLRLGNALLAAGQVESAIAAYEQAIRLNADYADAYYEAGKALYALGRFEHAEWSYRQVVRLMPQNAEAHKGLGVALLAQGKIDDALACCREAIRLDPRHADAWGSLGNALLAMGQVEQAIDCHRRVLAINPDYVQAHSNLIYEIHLNPDLDAQAIRTEQDRWNQRFAEPLAVDVRPYLSDRTRDRRLRVGYVSPDFRAHPVGRFLLPLLAAHDHAAVEIYLYSDVLAPDEMTKQLQQHADHWRPTVGMDDGRLAEMIREDRIDILVDLAMHTNGNRLLTFARKPAPVQVTWLAYASSSGLAAMNYRLTDPYLDPERTDLSVYAEASIRLPETYWCYEPGISTPKVNSLPALDNGYVTFGSLNNSVKMSEKVIDTWGRILQNVPASRLILHAPTGSHRNQIMQRLATRGVSSDRCTCIAKLPMSDYFAQYHAIDIGLDPFPYTGGTTTCDALWMGVPVVTLRGQTAVGRGGVSILSNAGLSDWIADSLDDYVRIAARWAADPSRLAALRGGLRQRFQESPLMDAPRFAHAMESCFRQIWSRWCAKTD